MYGALTGFVSSICNFTSAELDELCSLFKPVTLKKNGYFLKEGEICRRLAFLHKGMVRFFHLRDRIEQTSDFCFDNTFITGYHSLITGLPSDTSIQALEECAMLEISYETLFKLYKKNPKYERIGRIIAENNFLTMRRHLLSLLNDSAEKRYRNLLDRAPHFVQRISLLYIASYLGISPETLSRVRRKLSIS
jgi:CRP-like cAMP-binding protein